jgi:1,4-alpha-glucan branching enzyme
MLYAGQEIGANARKTIETNKIPWERLEDPNWAGLSARYAALASLRAYNPALTRNNLEPLLVDNERKLLVFKRWDEGGNQVVVGLNFSPQQQFAEITFPRGGLWHEWLLDYDEDLGEQPQRQIELPGSGGKIWVAT